MFCKKGVLKSFAKFTDRHLCRRLFLKRIFWNTYFYITPPVTASVFWGFKYLALLRYQFFTKNPRTIASELSFQGNAVDRIRVPQQNSKPFWIMILQNIDFSRGKRPTEPVLEALCEKSVLKYFVKVTGKHLCWILFQ